MVCSSQFLSVCYKKKSVNANNKFNQTDFIEAGNYKG